MVVKPKQQELIESLKLKSPLKRYKEKDFEVYNSFISEVDGEFNTVLEALLLKVTDFLNLNYNPDSDKFIHEKLGDKKFYLDSSVVMRMLGFNNEIREERARRLLELLKNIEGVHFFIHIQTLAETQDRVNKIIDESQKLLKHEEKLMRVTNSRSGKGSNTVDLYFRQKQRGEVQNIHDFTLYYSNISLLLRKLFGADRFSIDKDKIRKPSGKFDDLKDQLDKAKKSSPRVNHITKLLSHIELKRGGNNYNLFDIEFWLITTDNTTLTLDSELIKLEDHKIKSTCILPSELIRLIESAGEIRGDYIDVFKQYMLYSNIYREDYDFEEIKLIDKVLTLCESASSSTYDADFLLNNLFDKYSLSNIADRLKKLEEEKNKDEELISLFQQANEGYYEPKFLKLKTKETKRLSATSNVIYFLICFTIPALVLWYLYKVLVNPDLTWTDPKTYIIEDAFSKLEFIVTVVEVLIIPGSIFIYTKYRKSFVTWWHNKFRQNLNKITVHNST